MPGSYRPPEAAPRHGPVLDVGPIESPLMSRTSTLYEALGGAESVLRLARAWHQRVLADEIVAHAFAHGFHPQHTERLAAYWGEAWGGPTTYSERYGASRRRWSGSTAATVFTRRWTVGRSRVSARRWPTSPSPIPCSDAPSTIISPGRRQPR